MNLFHQNRGHTNNKIALHFYIYNFINTCTIKIIVTCYNLIVNLYHIL